MGIYLDEEMVDGEVALGEEVFKGVVVFDVAGPWISEVVRIWKVLRVDGEGCVGVADEEILEGGVGGELGKFFIDDFL